MPLFIEVFERPASFFATDRAPEHCPNFMTRFNSNLQVFHFSLETTALALKFAHLHCSRSEGIEGAPSCFSWMLA